MCKHLKDANETYFKHLQVSMKLANHSFLMSMIFLIHAIVPCVFTKTGSGKLARLQEIVDKRK